MEEMISKIKKHLEKVKEIKEKHGVPLIEWPHYAAEKDASAKNPLVKNFETRNL